jgi:hypothetical protein
MKMQKKSFYVEFQWAFYIYMKLYNTLGRSETVRVQSTYHELIPTRNASLAAMQGFASGSNIHYYPTWKHSPSKEINELGCYKLPDVCSYAMDHYVSLSLTNRKPSFHLHVLYFPRTALWTFTPSRDLMVVCGQSSTPYETTCLSTNSSRMKTFYCSYCSDNLVSSKLLHCKHKRNIITLFNL